ncbi:alpha/beta hydrolase [Amnibacterium sp. CER49]|uniref:alpha/beta hydrolase n=1 Tax=Amnibacterium sp. CER49 TaxID=3039161 RepID=UPI0024488C77|nr:alpha/beta hydrolase [Amnibacterium sp. CER49]MDH2442704.1 alpha/beta hydrolase [Amnibacterium sp. CER49]
MAGRVLALLVAASLTMGAVAAPPAVPTALVAPDRRAADEAVADLTSAVTRGDADRARIDLDARVLAATEPAPARTARWWHGLPAEARTRLLRVAPQVIGNLEGVPYDTRDTANRSALAAGLADAQRQQSQGTGRGEGVVLAQRLAALEQVAAALEAPPGGPRRELVTLDVSGGRAAVAVGDLATAEAVDFLVPGMYFTVADQIVDWTDTAAALQAQQHALAPRLRSGTSAVVAWIGYRTPDVFGVLSFGAARDGALRLADAVNGLNTVRGGDRPYLAVLAHSYGATAALLALQAHLFSADALAMIGAPGSPAQSVKQLAVRSGQVYVGHAVWDGVATSGFFGSDPASPGYGAVPLGTAGGRDPLTGARLTSAVGHMGYFAPTSEAMRNLALVGVDRGDRVTSDASTGTGVLALAR